MSNLYLSLPVSTTSNEFTNFKTTKNQHTSVYEYSSTSLSASSNSSSPKNYLNQVFSQATNSETRSLSSHHTSPISTSVKKTTKPIMANESQLKRDKEAIQSYVLIYLLEKFSFI